MKHGYEKVSNLLLCFVPASSGAALFLGGMIRADLIRQPGSKHPAICLMGIYHSLYLVTGSQAADGSETGYNYCGYFGGVTP